MEQRKITCIVCPLGCEIKASMDGDKIVDISGYSCEKGKSYAISEITDPRRTLTTTMRVRDGKSPLVSVKSQKPIKNDLLFSCMKQINMAEVIAPVKIGDTVIKNIYDTGVDIVATKSIEGV